MFNMFSVMVTLAQNGNIYMAVVLPCKQVAKSERT